LPTSVVTCYVIVFIGTNNNE